MSETSIQDRWANIQERIHQAVARSGRGSHEVTVVAVSKQVEVPYVMEAMEAGLVNFGENRIQEAKRKIPSVPGARWHLIGPIQTNKANDAAAWFQLIHSVDRWEVVLALQREAEKRQGVVHALLQVNVSGEATKHGIRPSDAEAFLAQARSAPRVEFHGLMTMAPFTPHADDARPVFRELRRMCDRLADQPDGRRCTWCSMGMSNDYEVAIEEGANMIRLGSAIFGPR